MRFTLYASLLALFLTACSSSVGVDTSLLLNKDPVKYPVVATVNGEDIDRSFYQKNLLAARRNALVQNRDPFTAEVNKDLKTAVLDQMIGNVLLAQQAEEDETEVDITAVDAQLEQVRAQYESEEALIVELESNGSSLEELKTDLERSVRVQVFLENYFTELELEVTSEEIQTTYDEAAANNEVPVLDEVQEAIEQQLLQQKQQTAVEELIKTLRKQSDVVLVD